MAEPTREQVRDVIATVPGFPHTGEAPVFAEPWQAQAFAMAVSLHQNGLFTWSEWAETLGAEIRKAVAAGDPDDGSTYYNHWMATLERLVAEKGLTSAETLDRYAQAWGRAADRTPHGEPIELEAGDFE
jgi:nitrile hydratase accessory protein